MFHVKQRQLADVVTRAAKVGIPQRGRLASHPSRSAQPVVLEECGRTPPTPPGRRFALHLLKPDQTGPDSLRRQSRVWKVLAVFIFAFAVLGAVGCSGRNQARGWAAPVKTDAFVLVSTGKGRLDAIDRVTRDPIWRFPNRWNIPDSKARGLAGIYASPVIESESGAIFVGDYNGYLYAFRPRDLNQSATDQKPNAASLKLGDPVIGGLALDSATDTLFVTAGDRVLAISVSDMLRRIENRDASVDVVERFRAGGELWSKPVVQGSMVFFASLDGNLYALDKTTGAEVWRFKGTRALVSTPVVAGSILLVGGFDDRLHAIDMNTGDQRWEFVASNWIWSAPLVDGSRIYVGDFDGVVHALNLSDGSRIWSTELGGRPIVASPVLAQGVLVVASQDGEIFGLDPSERTIRWGPAGVRAPLNADLVGDDDSVLIAPSNCVTLPGGTSRVYYVSLDARTGALRSTSEVC